MHKTAFLSSSSASPSPWEEMMRRIRTCSVLYGFKCSSFSKKCQCDPVAVFCLKLHLLAFAHPMQSPGHHSRLAWVGMLKGNFSASWPLQTLTWLFAHIKNDKLLWINWVIKSILALPGTSHQPPLPYLIQQWRIWLVDIWCRSDFNFLSKSCDLTQGGW